MRKISNKAISYGIALALSGSLFTATVSSKELSPLELSRATNFQPETSENYSPGYKQDEGLGLGYTLSDSSKLYQTERVTGMITGLRHLSDSRFENVIYAAPDQSQRDTGKPIGSKENPYTLDNAIAKAESIEGCTVLLLDGTYHRTDMLRIKITNNGTDAKYKVLKAAKGADVILDYSGQTGENKNNVGIRLDGAYWYIGGIRVNGTQSSNGMRVFGSYNVIEDCVFSNNGESGFQLDNHAKGNYILNSTSYNNCDTDNYGDADGFAPKLKVGEGNVFDGCIAYNNLDDGWDLFAKTDSGGPIEIVTIRNSITAWNGDTTDKKAHSVGEIGEGNGFKLGGSGLGTPHIVYNCLSFENAQHGYTDNKNPSALNVTYSSSTDNGQLKGKGAGFSLYRTSEDAVFEGLLTIVGYKNLEYKDELNGKISNSVIWFNKFYRILEQMSINRYEVDAEVIEGPTAEDFISLTPPNEGAELHKVFRNQNGTINTHGYMELKEESQFYGLGSQFNGNYELRELPVDLNPPELKDVEISIPIGENHANISFDISLGGTYYYLITDSETPPAENEILSGNLGQFTLGNSYFDVNLSLKKQYLHFIVKDELGYYSEPYSIPIISNGDLNGDDIVNIADVLTFLQYSVGMKINDFNVSLADINGDEKIDNRDATYLMRIIAQK